jgi:K+-transporting ATPase ATPase A chain
VTAATAGVLFLAVLAAALAAFHVPLGDYMYRVYTSQKHGRIDRLVYRLIGANRSSEQSWAAYARSVLAFSAVSVLFLFFFQLLQDKLPLHLHNPATPMTPALAWNTAISFVTNTNWQAYSGESTQGHLVQMAGLAVQNFVSAAVGIAVVAALIRGFTRKRTDRVGNFWVDLTRATLWVLLPLSVVLALALVSQGVIQNLRPYDTVRLVEPQGPRTTQTIAQGPVASQEAIKMLGTNGGGFFNANSAHPFENPTPLVNLIQLVLIFSLGAGLTNVFGRMVGDERQGWAIFAVMFLLYIAGVAVAYAAEAPGNPAFAAFHVDSAASALQAGGNMEGKEVRFGIANSALFATITTDASCGAVTSMHDSLMPLGGMVPMVNIMLGEIIYGGVGSGLYGMLLFVVITVFVAGLMVGRTPEYLGKKINPREIKLAASYFLVTPLIVLTGTAVAMALPGERAGMLNTGPHGLSEVLYAFTSAANNNGSAFAGISVNTNWYNTALGLAMVFGRFLPMVLVLALAGSLAKQGHTPESAGTLPTHRPQFVGMVAGVTVILVALTFLPMLALGPLAEGIH